MCETLSNKIVGPAYTIDPGPLQAPPLDRAFNALDLAESVLARSKNEKVFNHSVETIRNWIIKNAKTGSSFRLWLGASCQENGDPVIKLYLNFTKEFLHEVLSSIKPLLKDLHREPSETGFPVMALLSQEGYVKQIGLTLHPDGVAKVKLYYRLRRIDYSRLQHLCGVAQISPQIFSKYIQQMLQGKSDWSDRRSGIGMEIGCDGQCDVLALYHYSDKYFLNDEILRKRVELFGRQCGWNLSKYRQICRLLQYDFHSCQRPLMGFSVTKEGGTALRLYSSTGNLMQGKTVNSVSRAPSPINELVLG